MLILLSLCTALLNVHDNDLFQYNMSETTDLEENLFNDSLSLDKILPCPIINAAVMVP